VQSTLCFVSRRFGFDPGNLLALHEKAELEVSRQAQSSDTMLIQKNQAFNPSADFGTRSTTRQHMLRNMLTSVYSSVLNEPLPERLETLVRELEMRDQKQARLAG
jgi:hypothetical protein